MTKTTNDNADIEQSHLDWTKKQGYILTCGGKAESFYTAERGFPFVETDLPHYHLLKGDTHSTFKDFRSSKLPCSLIAGAWNRPLFTGGWKHSSDKEEYVYNIQTNNLFIDFRVPRSRELVLTSKATSLDELNAYELRLYARQHIFAGYTVLDNEKNRPVATRHHCIDWNFVGVSRPRPNKWWIEVNDDDNSAWKEYAYAKDDNGQHYYFEKWERLEGGMSEPRLALKISPSQKRKSSSMNKIEDKEEDEKCHVQEDNGIFVLVGDHFNYVTSRKFSGSERSYNNKTSLVDLVDEAVANGDLITARSYLSIEGGHGRVSNKWKLDCAIPSWNEGKDIQSVGDGCFVVTGTDILSCSVVWKGYNWDVFDCSFESVDELKGFLAKNTTNEE